MPYHKFALMIGASTIVMFGLMYLNTYTPDHLAWSQTRMWMALVMGSAMAVIMLGFMWSMYSNPAANVAIIVACLAVFATSLYLVRTQRTVDDVSYMKAMIPHHSIAILTSTQAQITDPRVRRLADEIVQAQVREIGEMKGLIEDLE